MKKIALLMLVVAGLSGCGEAARSPSGAFTAQARGIVDKLIEESFPELEGQDITIVGIDSPSVFLATDIDIPGLLTGQRRYLLMLNPHLEEQPMGEDALRAILAHELVHFSDYTTMSAPEIALFYVRILTSDAFQADYERATDLEALRRGYGPGLKLFRQWLYRQISPEAVERKKRNYYTPGEIDAWLAAQ